MAGPELGELADLVRELAVVHGRVTLSSGKEADYYVDLRRITLDAAAAPLIGPAMLELTKDLEYDAVGGLTLGADPVAMSMLHAAAQEGRKLDAFVVRKAEKTHGLQRRIEGPDVKGRRVLAVDQRPHPIEELAREEPGEEAEQDAERLVEELHGVEPTAPAAQPVGV